MRIFTWSDDRVLRYATGVFVVLWMASVGPLRTWASEAGIRSLWWFGIAPSLFSGAAFATWQAVATSVRAWTSAAYAVVLTLLAEGVQLAMANATADPWDIVAGSIGAGVGGLIVAWRERVGEHPSRPDIA
ncbi:MAG: hypothetical protein AAGJ10_18865 [Bacteroidota bacterium]